MGGGLGRLDCVSLLCATSDLIVVGLKIVIPFVYFATNIVTDGKDVTKVALPGDYFWRRFIMSNFALFLPTNLLTLGEMIQSSRHSICRDRA